MKVKIQLDITRSYHHFIRNLQKFVEFLAIFLLIFNFISFIIISFLTTFFIIIFYSLLLIFYLIIYFFSNVDATFRDIPSSNSYYNIILYNIQGIISRGKGMRIMIHHYPAQVSKRCFQDIYKTSCFIWTSFTRFSDVSKTSFKNLYCISRV